MNRKDSEQDAQCVSAEFIIDSCNSIGNNCKNIHSEIFLVLILGFYKYSVHTSNVLWYFVSKVKKWQNYTNIKYQLLEQGIIHVSAR